MAVKLDYTTNADTITKKFESLLDVTEKQEKVGLRLDKNAKQLDRTYNKLAQTVDRLTQKFKELNRVSGVGPSGQVNVNYSRGSSSNPSMGLTNALLLGQLGGRKLTLPKGGGVSRVTNHIKNDNRVTNHIKQGYTRQQMERARGIGIRQGMRALTPLEKEAWRSGTTFGSDIATAAARGKISPILGVGTKRVGTGRAHGALGFMSGTKLGGRGKTPMMNFGQGGFEAISKGGGAVGGAAGQFASAMGAASAPLVALGVAAAAGGIALAIYKGQLDKNREVAGRYAAAQEEAIKKLVDAQKAIATSAMDMQTKLLPMQLQGQLLGISPDELKKKANLLAATTPITDYEQATAAVVTARKKFGGKASSALELAALGERAGVGTVSDILDKLTKKGAGKDIMQWPSVLAKIAKQQGMKDPGVEARIAKELGGGRSALTSRAMIISQLVSEEQYKLGLKGERGPESMQQALATQDRVRAFLGGVSRPDLTKVKAQVGPMRRLEQLLLTKERMKTGGEIVKGLTPESRAGLEKLVTDPFTRQTIEILDEMQRVKKELKAQAKESTWMQAGEVIVGGPLDEMVIKLNELNRQLEALSENMKKVNGSTTPTTGAGR